MVVLAELEIFCSRPHAPTRRVALGEADLPCEPAPGFGGILLGGVVAGVVPFFLYRKGAIGGGDVKLFVALGMLGRMLVGLEFEFASLFVAGFLLLPVKLAYEGKLLKTLMTSGRLAINSILPKSRQLNVEENFTWFKLGPAIFLGVCLESYLRWGQSW